MWEPCHYNQITILKIVVWLRLENIYGSVWETEAKPRSSKYNLETSFGLGVTVQGLSTCQWLCGSQQIKGKVGRLWETPHQDTAMPSQHARCLTPLPHRIKAFPSGHTGETTGGKMLRNLLPSCPAHHQPRGSSSPLTSSVLWLSVEANINCRLETKSGEEEGIGEMDTAPARSYVGILRGLSGPGVMNIKFAIALERCLN